MTYLPEPKVSGATRWAYAGCPGVGTDDLMRAPYERARDLVRMPTRYSAGRTPVAEKCGIGTTMAGSLAVKRGQENYALRMELGERAYAQLLGRPVKRSKAVAKPRPVAKDLGPPPEASAKGVVLVTGDLAKRLGLVNVMGGFD